MHDLDGHFVVRHSIARTIAAGVAAGAAMNTVFRVLRAVEPLRGAARADGGRARVLDTGRRRGSGPGSPPEGVLRWRLGGVRGRAHRSLVAADLVDEYWLKFNPAIVGRGGSMFSDVVERRALTLRSARSFPSGAVAAIYSKYRRSGDPCWKRGTEQLPPSHPPAMANPGLKHVEPSWIETTGG